MVNEDKLIVLVKQDSQLNDKLKKLKYEKVHKASWMVLGVTRGSRE